MGATNSTPAPGEAKKESATLLQKQPPAESSSDGALEEGGAINIYDWRRMGYLAQYFAVGIIYGGLPATQYGFYIAYLNVPAYVSSAVATLATFPWSFKILFALVTDALPIGGYRRRPYMCLGWLVATMFLIALASLPLPDPYYCFDDAPPHRYNLTSVCNEDARSAGMPFAILTMCVAIGYVQADVAADALTVQYARREPVATRGKTQTTAYLTRTCGQVVAQLLVGFGMNGREYNGSFASGLSFSAVCAILAVPSVLMVPISWYLVEEPKLVGTPNTGNKGTRFVPLTGNAKGDTKQAKAADAPTAPHPADDADETPWTLRSYCSTAGELLKSGLLFEVVCYSFFSAVIGGIGTTAGAEVQRVWADVENLPNQLFTMAGHFLFMLGLWIMRARYLGASWRVVIATTLVVTNLIDMPFTFCTIFNVVRNQYFFLDDALLTSIPSAMNFVVATYVMVEVAEPGTEGITYGMLTTAANVGGPVATGLSNWLFGYWDPSLSESSNYVKDAQSFRNEVANSYWLTYGFAFASLAFLPLLPNQKADTQARKASRPRGTPYAVASVSLIALAIAYSFTVSMLTVFPATSCLQIAGGEGCDLADGDR